MTVANHVTVAGKIEDKWAAACTAFLRGPVSHTTSQMSSALYHARYDCSHLLFAVAATQLRDITDFSDSREVEEGEWLKNFEASLKVSEIHFFHF